MFHAKIECINKFFSSEMLVRTSMEIFDYYENSFLSIDHLKSPFTEEQLKLCTVEDVIFRLLSRHKINALAAHLFGLYDETTNCWLCPSQPWLGLSEFLENQEQIQLYLRIRFLGYDASLIYVKIYFVLIIYFH